jgi:phospho-N-acetylmuramoyl-pentapeptide-transferase
MIAIIVAAGVSLLVALFGTPLFIRFLVARQYGQFIRQDGPTAHFTKRGTPTMGGVVIIGATLLGWLGAQIATGAVPSASAVLVLFLMTGLGVVGFLDDFIKISRQRSLGLSARWKIVGQGVVGIVFAVAALQFPNDGFRTPASTHISFIRDTTLVLPGVIAIVLFWVMVTGTSNAVNLTDGLDGLATMPVVIAAGTFAIIAYLVGRADYSHYLGIPHVAGAGELAIMCAGMMGAGLAFLWFNAPPAAVFMGDTGSLALGGALGAIAVASHHEIVLLIVGGLFVVETASVVIQVYWFKRTGRRVFRMAPIHHHFEQLGWSESTVVIRFWIVSIVLALLGLATLKVR